MFSSASSDKRLTATGEKIPSRPRTMWRSTTWVVIFATNVFCRTLMHVSGGIARISFFVVGVV
jgi:hypothetical protein